MEATLVVQFWVVAVLLALTPGADWAYAITAGLRARSVAPSILGMLAGYTVVVAVVAVGVGALVAERATALTVLTVAGSSYLVFLGLSTLVGTAQEVAVVGGPVDDRPAAQFFRGTAVSGLNPKGLLLLLALLPQFTSPTGWSSSSQMLVLGSLHLLNCAVIYLAVALLAKKILRSRPRASAVVTKAAGAIMTLIGAGILVEQVALLL